MAKIRELSPADADAVFALFEACADDWNDLFGLPPTPGDFHSVYTIKPADAEYSQKHVVGIEADDGHLIAFADLVRDYPEAGSLTVGFVLVEPHRRREGIGRGIVDWARAAFAQQTVTMAVPDRAPTIGFAESLGLTASGERTDNGDLVYLSTETAA